MKTKFTITAKLPDRVRVFVGSSDLQDQKLPLAEVAMGLLKSVQDEERLHACTSLKLEIEVV